MAKKNEDSNENFSDWFQKRLDAKNKERAKQVKQFKHTVHNYPTGMLVLDYFINPHNPGILGGHVVQFAGKGGSGKTTTALNIAALHMDQGHEVHYYDPEGGLTDSMIEGYGYPKYGHPNFKYMGGRNAYRAVDYFELIRDTLEHLQGEPDPVLIIIDSITYLRPEVENFETVRVGDNIPFFNNFLRAVVPKIKNTNCLLVLLNGVYQDNKSMHGGVVVSGGETLVRACDLVFLHEKRANNTGASVPADEKTFIDINKNFSVSYRQKLAVKILKNKWRQADTKLSTMEHYFNTDKRFGKFGLDNVHSMMSFLKDMGEFSGSGVGWYAIDGQNNMRWADWEEAANNNAEMRQLLISKTLSVLNNLFHGEIK